MTSGVGEQKRVRHGSYGVGTVTKVERGGLSLRVRFDRFPGLEVSLPARLLRLVDADGSTRAVVQRSQPPPAVRPQPLDLDAMEKRQVLEAVRLGVVPMKGLLAYTVGRDREVEVFRSMMDRGSADRALAVLGDYGTGKTHMLELMQRIALEDNWVVGRAWLDPQEAPPSKPRRVYAALVRSLVYPDRPEAGECGLWPLLEGAARVDELCDGLVEGEDRHVFLAPAVRYARGILEGLEEDPASQALSELQILLTHWIEGRATGMSQDLQRRLHWGLAVRDRVLALSDFGTLPRVYGYLLSGLGLLARKQGYRGLLLLLDETELFSSLDLEERARAVDVFRVLMGAASPAAGAGSIDLSEVRRGGRGIIRDLPPRFAEESYLSLALAATPGSASETFLRETLGEARVLELGYFGKPEFREMGDRILNLYLGTYPEMSRRVLAALEAKMDYWLAGGFPQSPREFGRRCVDFLDQCRHTTIDFS